MGGKVLIRINEYERFGWTEDFYWVPPSGGAVWTKVLADAWAARRARCLDSHATILDVRYSDDDNPRQVTSFSQDLPGALGAGIISTQDGDVSMVAVQVDFKAGVSGTRHMLQRGLVDGDVVNGKLTYAISGIAPFTDYWKWIRDTSNFGIKSYTKNDHYPIATIDGATGTLTVQSVGGFLPVYAPGRVIVIKSRVAGNGCKIVWTGRIKAKTGDAVYTLVNWKKGNASGGVVYSTDPVYTKITSYSPASPPYAHTRRTGPPFGQSRGRRSRTC